MAKCLIKVLRKDFNKDLVDEYCGVNVTPCSKIAVGQVFTVEDMNQPAGFCYWAWHDVYPVVFALMKDGGFAPRMKDKNTMIVSCSDGLRPVIFELKRVD